MRHCLRLLFGSMILLGTAEALRSEETPRFSRHVAPLLSRLGCNGGTCHGAVKGQNGFRLSLFGADPALDHERLLKEFAGRRVNLLDPDASLILRKATGQVQHQGGKRMDLRGPEYQIFRRWIAAGGTLDALDQSRVVSFQVTPAVQTVKPGDTYRLRVDAKFSDGSTEDITQLCTFDSIDRQVASVQPTGDVRAEAVGDTALVIRYRAQPTVAQVMVSRPGNDPFPDIASQSFIDRHVQEKLRRLNVPPAPLADDATFLRRVSLDVAGELPTPAEIRAFLGDASADQRERKIDELLARPGHAAVWALKFCDLLKGGEFGVYADGMSLEMDAPRFYQWVRSRLEENMPYDEFVERILTATSREGRSFDDWSREGVGLFEGFNASRADVALFSRRRTLDLYWQRGAATGVPGTLQIAHAFLGLRLECAQCHRHPHDIWRQDDLLSFANFFMHVRKPGFQGDNDKKFPEVAAYVNKLSQEAKELTEKAKQLRETKGKELDAAAKKAKPEVERLLREAAQLEAKQLLDEAAAKRKLAEPFQAAVAQNDQFLREVGEMDRRAKFLPEAGKRLLHAEILHLPGDGKNVASVTSPLGTQSSSKYRLLGQTDAIDVPADQDPRPLVMAWLRRPDNPYFARAIVNRVWAHYFGRGLVDPPDNLSSFNPASHPQLLDELGRRFIDHGYDLRWLNRTIVQSRTYQQSSEASPANEMDHSNYAYFYFRRLGAEVLVDAMNQATGTTENMDMRYWNWPDQMKTIEVPFTPRNAFVVFMLEQFGRPQRNSAVQCDCEREPNPSVLQVLSFANHPRVRQKIADEKGQVARILKDFADESGRIDEVFLCTLSRLPDEKEREACLKFLLGAESPGKGLQGIMWSLLNTKEFLLQH